MEYLKIFDCLENIVFDISLARGLGYYTGIMFEITTLDTSIGVGSIGAGGNCKTKKCCD
jgi:histidyl-tRNA synthetase